MNRIKILLASFFFAIIFIGCGNNVSLSDIEAKANEFATRTYEAICRNDYAAEQRIDSEMDDYLSTLTEEQQSSFISVYSDKMIEYMNDDLEGFYY